MRKNSKKILTASLIASFALTTALGVSVFAMPKAEADFSDFTMDTGAGVKMDDATGIRFTANVGEKTQASLENATDIVFGTLIAPTLGADNVLTLEDVNDNSVNAKNLVTAVWTDGADNYEASTSKSYNGAIVGDSNKAYPENKYGTALNAVGYVKYTVDEQEYVEYTANTANRSLAQAAANALANGMADTNGALSAIVAKTIDSVSFADETVELTLNATKAEKATVTASADVDASVVTVSYVSSNPTVATVDVYGNVTAKSEGSATITASVGNVKDTLDVVVEGSTTLLNDCAAVGSVDRTSWGWPTTTTTNDALTTLETTAPVGVPANYNGSSTNTNYTSQQAMLAGGDGADGRAIPSFEISSFFKNIKSYDGMDYIGIWVYVESNASTLWDSCFGLSKGQPHIASSAYTVATTVGATLELAYRDGIPCNQWTMLKLPVSSIRALMETKPEVEYDTLFVDLRFGGNAGKVYYYAVDFYTFDGLLLDGTNAGSFDGTNWGGKDATMVTLPDTISAPTAPAYTGNATGNVVARQQVANGPNMVQNYVGFSLYSFFENIENYDMNDYIGVWTYFESSTDNMIDSVLLYASVGKTFAGNYSSYGATEKNSNCLPTNQWVMVKIGLAEIFACMAKNPSYAYNELCIEFRATKETQTKYVYYYSVDLYEVEGTTLTLNECDSTSTVNRSSWVSNTTAVVTDSPKGAPANYTGLKTGTNYASQTITVQSNNKLTRHFPALSVGKLMSYLSFLKDTDYIGLWVYIEAPEGFTSSSYLKVALSTSISPHVSGATQSSAVSVAPVVTNTWTMVKVPISTIRSLVEANSGVTFNTIWFEYRDVNEEGKETQAYYNSAETEKIYFYALDLYTGA